MMIIDNTEDSLLRGKTGWSITNEISNGWFVGYLETNDNTIYFATNIQPMESFNMDNFGAIRKVVTLKALRTK
jgi:beta-lactamase class D